MPTVEWNKKNWTKNAKVWANNKMAEHVKHYGDQWGDPFEKEHLSQVFQRFIIPYINPKQTCLEIGSGGGRWTQFLAEFKKVHAVDVNKVMLDLVADRYKDRKNINYVLSEGSNFPGVRKSSVDFVFSYDVFVHIDPLEVYEYLVNVANVTKKKSTICIHYADQNKPAARRNPGFARNNPTLMRCMVEHAGFEIIEEEFELLKHSSIMVFKPKTK